KTADVSSVHAAGDQINYSITVQNTGNTTLTNPEVTDSTINIVTPVLDFSAPIIGTTPLLVPILNGDYNAGDVGTLAHPEFAQNGIQDPGETFQYANAGAQNQMGIHVTGQAFHFANIDQNDGNGVEDPCQSLHYYTAADVDTD